MSLNIIDIKSYFNDLDIPPSFECPPGQQWDDVSKSCVPIPEEASDSPRRLEAVTLWNANRVAKNENAINIAEAHFIKKYGTNWRETIPIGELERWNSSISFYGNQADPFWKFMLIYNMVEPGIWATSFIGSAAVIKGIQGGAQRLLIGSMARKAGIPHSWMTEAQLMREGYPFAKEVTGLYARNLGYAKSALAQPQSGPYSSEMMRLLGKYQKELGALPKSGQYPANIIDDVAHRMAQEMTDIERAAIRANRTAMYGKVGPRTGIRWGEKLPTSLSKQKRALSQLPFDELSQLQQEALYEPKTFRNWLHEQTYGKYRNWRGKPVPDIEGSWQRTPWDIEGEQLYNSIKGEQTVIAQNKAAELARQKYIEMLKKSGNLVDDLTLGQKELLNQIMNGTATKEWNKATWEGLEESMKRTGMWDNLDEATKTLIEKTNRINKLKPAFDPGTYGGKGSYVRNFDDIPNFHQMNVQFGRQAQLNSEIPKNMDDWLNQNIPEGEFARQGWESQRETLSRLQDKIDEAYRMGDDIGAEILQRQYDDIAKGLLRRIDDYGISGNPLLEVAGAYIRGGETLATWLGRLSHAYNLNATQGFGTYLATGGSTAGKGMLLGEGIAGIGAQILPYLIAEEVYGHFSNPSNQTSRISRYNTDPAPRYFDNVATIGKDWYNKSGGGNIILPGIGGLSMINPEAVFRSIGATALGLLQAEIPFTGGSGGVDIYRPQAMRSTRAWMVDPEYLSNLGLNPDEIEAIMPYMQFQRGYYAEMAQRPTVMRPSWGSAPQAYSGISPGAWVMANRAGNQDWTTYGITGGIGT